MKYAKLELLERTIGDLLFAMQDSNISQAESRYDNAITLRSLLESYKELRQLVDTTELE